MESGWIINYKDGFKAILTEEKYISYREIRDVEKIESEEHWFSIEDAKRKNPDIFVVE